ncbi:hypothetical protein HY025_02795 [Candidatus Daviesbacteria bacterium]|nr:hypothetical protein [Candidatus Daviesbacteria bacterium]
MGQCTGDAKNCQGQISIGPKGKTQGSYEVKVTDTTSTSNLFGITNLIVTTPINTTTQGSSGVCTTVPSSVKNCSDFKTGDYIINIPVNKTCTTSDGNPKGVQCANTSDQFCKASDGTTIQCAALTSCKDSLVCRTGYTTEACDSSVDTSKNCCAQINGAIIQDPKVACSVIQTTTTGAQPCDPTPETTGTGIKTAIGCIPTQPQQLVQGFVRVISFASGGIALLLMIFGAIGIITSAGNPERLKQSQEQFTSAIIGLLFIIFSVLLLQIIGVDILNIPGFGRS